MSDICFGGVLMRLLTTLKTKIRRVNTNTETNSNWIYVIDVYLYRIEYRVTTILCVFPSIIRCRTNPRLTALKTIIRNLTTILLPFKLENLMEDYLKIFPVVLRNYEGLERPLSDAARNEWEKTKCKVADNLIVTLELIKLP